MMTSEIPFSIHRCQNIMDNMLEILKEITVKLKLQNYIGL